MGAEEDEVQPESLVALGGWLASLAEERGYSNRQVAGMIGTDTTNIGRWFAGKHDPGSLTLLSLFAALGVKVTPEPPEKVPLAVNAELRALRNELAHGRVSVAFAPYTAHLTERERELAELMVGGDPEQEPVEDFVDYLRDELGLTLEEAEAEYQLIRDKIKGHPENQRREAEVMEELWASALAGDPPSFGPPPLILEPDALEALREAVDEIQKTLTDHVLADLADVRTRLERLEVARSLVEDPPTDQAVEGSRQ